MLNSVSQVALIYSLLLFMMFDVYQNIFSAEKLFNFSLIMVFPCLMVISRLHRQMVGGYALAAMENIRWVQLSALGFSILFALALQSAFLNEISDLKGTLALEFARNLAMLGFVWTLVGMSVAVSGKHVGAGIPWAVLFVFAAGIASNTQGFSFDYVSARNYTGLDALSHLWISEYFVFVFFCAYAVTRHLAARVLLLFIALSVLISLGGRSSLILTYMTVLFFEVVIRRAVASAYALALVVTLSLVAAALIWVWLISASYEDVQRHLLLTGLDSDLSWVGRVEGLREALAQTGQTYFYGDPTLIATTFGDIGLYAHNIISAWQFFGLPFFLVSGSILIMSCRDFIIAATSSNASSGDNFCALFSIYVMLSLLTTKAITYFGFWILIGMWLVVRKNAIYLGGDARRPEQTASDPA